jgi:1-acyl-sn-glycerol-3-phosphate acyltransferase
MKNARKKTEMQGQIQLALEKHRRFDYDYIPFGNRWKMPGADYRYRRGFFRKITCAAVRTITFLFGPILIGTVYGARVKGRKNLKPLRKKGAISVCNHFSYLDTLFVRQAVGHYRSFHTMAPWNNKKGIGGWFMHRGGMLPFSSNLTATRNLWKELEKLFKAGKIVNFYAEQAMWLNYQKPRPMKEGAFYYAIKFGVPVIPVFCTFGKNKRGHIKKLRIHILPAVYADETLPKGERAEKMRTQAQEAWKGCYEKAYGIPLEYAD